MQTAVSAVCSVAVVPPEQLWGQKSGRTGDIKLRLQNSWFLDLQGSSQVSYHKMKISVSLSEEIGT